MTTLAAGSDTVNPLVTDLVLVLAASATVAVALQRLRLALVSAYLIAGAILGPHMLGLVQSAERLSAIADLAIILLMFTIGLQIDLGLIRANLRMTVLVGAGSVACCWLVGWPIAMAFGLSAPAALAVSMALSLSSTAVVLRALADRRELRQPHGRLAFGVLVVQDMAVLLALVLVPILKQWADGGAGGSDTNSTETAGSFLQLVFRAILAISGVVVVIVLGRWLLPRLLNEAARSGSRDLTLIVATASAVGAGMATRWLGFSAELGAFLAGLVLASTPFRHQLSGQIGPLRDVFIAVFFTTLGMRMNAEAVTTHWYIVLAGVVALLGLKSGLIYAAVKYGGATMSVAALVGISLAQAGEFSLVVVSESADEGLISETVANNCVAITVISLLLTPALISVAHRVAARLAHGPREADDTPAPSVREFENDHVVIGGFGPVGRAVAERLDHANVPYTVIEMNPKTVRIESSLGRSMVYGDASNPAVLESAGVLEATALVLSLPDEEATLASVRTARSMSPELFIVVRTIVVSKAMLARSLGADEVVSDELASADAMQRAVRRRLIEERLKRGDHTLEEKS